MNPGEHALMARVEETHWWYRGLRDAIARTLARPDLALGPAPRVLDAGCGTGANLRLLAERLTPACLAGFDVSAEALAFARAKVPTAHVVAGDIRDPPLPGAPYDLVLSMDVICIPGLDASMPGLERLAGALRPGGLFMLNLPAYPWLMSEHDRAVHTTERFTATSVARLYERLGLELVVLTYRLCVVVPLVVARRLPGLVWRDRSRPPRSDLHAAPGRMIDAVLSTTLIAENALIARGWRLPWGSSVFAIGRR
jgi:SAM-dependent methyltransferase